MSDVNAVQQKSLFKTATTLSVRAFYAALGLICIAFALIGLILPLMPTTIFVLIAGYFFARSSPRLEAWLINHRWFGPVLQNWRKTGAVPPFAKRMATGFIGVGFAIFVITSNPSPLLALFVAAAMAAIIAFLLSRPDA